MEAFAIAMDRCPSLLIELCQFSSNIYEIKSERYLSEAQMLNRISGIVNNPNIRNDFGVRGSVFAEPIRFS
jgi:hypothetical protein